MLSRLSGMKLALDGDLLIYRDWLPAAASAARNWRWNGWRALGHESGRVSQDLRLEKTAFSQSALYQKVLPWLAAMPRGQ